MRFFRLKTLPGSFFLFGLLPSGVAVTVFAFFLALVLFFNRRMGQPFSSEDFDRLLTNVVAGVLLACAMFCLAAGAGAAVSATIATSALRRNPGLPDFPAVAEKRAGSGAFWGSGLVLAAAVVFVTIWVTAAVGTVATIFLVVLAVLIVPGIAFICRSQFRSLTRSQLWHRAQQQSPTTVLSNS